MSLPLLFARRYMRSRKSLSVINIIARVSSAAIGVAVAAMVILLSVYNGFDAKLRAIYNTVDPDLLVTPLTGKNFAAADIDTAALARTDGVEALSMLLEDNILVEYGSNRKTAVLRGVDENYTSVVPTDDMIWYGSWRLRYGKRAETVVGRAIDELFADGYSVKNTAMHSPLKLYAPRRENISPLLPFSAFRTADVSHAGTLTPDATNLTDHIFVAADVAQRLLGAEGRYSAVALKIATNANPKRVARAVGQSVGADFKVATREQQNALAYRVMKYEKWSIFFILLLVTIIAAFSSVGSIVMLIVDKRSDIEALSAIGADNRLLRRVFRTEGALVGGAGVAGGLLVGVLFCMLQQRFGIITIPGNTFLFTSYPVKVEVADLLGIAASVMAVNYIIANFTVAKMIPRKGMPYETRN